MDHSNLSIKKGGKNIPANWQVYIIINDASLPPPHLHLFARLQILMRLSLPLPPPSQSTLALNEAKSGKKKISSPIQSN